MIINKEHQFSFIHIPKCAGTHIKRALSHVNDYDCFVKNIQEYEGVGRIDFAHIPLNTLENLFPIIYGEVKESKSYTVVREPISRFASAISQYSKATRGTAIKDLHDKEICEDIQSVIIWLRKEGHKDLYPPEKVYFTPQHRYIYNGGEQIVDNIFNLSDLPLLEQDILNLFSDKNLIFSKSDVESNRTVEYKTGLFSYAVKHLPNPFRCVLKSTLPNKLIRVMQRKVYQASNNRVLELLTPDQVEFINLFYKLDNQIVNSLSQD